MITIKEISLLSDNMKECISLEVLPDQWEYVALNADSLAEAYDTNKEYEKNGEGARAFPYAIYKDDVMVGFIMLGYFPAEEGEEALDTENSSYYIWRLFVDKRYQGQGIGKAALSLMMDFVKTKPYGDATYCFSSYVPENIASKSTFASYGYEEDGRVMDGEAYCRYKL